MIFYIVGITVDHDGYQYGVETGAVYDGSTTAFGNKIEVDVDSVVQYYVSLAYKF